MFYYAIKHGVSIVEFFSTRGNAIFVETLRARFGHPGEKKELAFFVAFGHNRDGGRMPDMHENSETAEGLLTDLPWGTARPLTVTTPSGETRKVRGYGTLSLEIADPGRYESPREEERESQASSIRDHVVSALKESLLTMTLDPENLTAIPAGLIEQWRAILEREITSRGLSLLTLDVINLRIGDQNLRPPEPPPEPEKRAEEEHSFTATPTSSAPKIESGTTPSTLTCPGCSAPVPSGAKFCPSCGERLQFACPSCGKEIPPASRFCPWCGGEISITEGR